MTILKVLALVAIGVIIGMAIESSKKTSYQAVVLDLDELKKAQGELNKENNNE